MLLKSAFIVLVAFTGGAFATLHDLTGTLNGKGTWNMPNGSKGTWTSVFSIAKAEKGVAVKEVLTIKDGAKEEVQEMAWQVVEKEHGFFDIVMDGKVTGWGHCEHKVCQLNSAGKSPNGRWAETLKMTKNGMLRIGTDHADEYQVAWRGVMTKK